MRRIAALLVFGGALATGATSCLDSPMDAEGQLGRPIPLLSGDDSPLPRLMFVDEGCPGSEVAVGGCPAGGERQCQPLLLDSLLPVTTLRNADPSVDSLSLSLECLELRASAGLAAAAPSVQDRDRAVTRLRLRDVPVLRAAANPSGDWTWLAGVGTDPIEPAGVIGGNVLRELAVEVGARGEVRTISFFREFPGSDADLAGQGWSFLPVQFPGRLLGKAQNDRCDVDGHDCDLPGVHLLPSNEQLALVSSRMVMDACVATPPCTVQYLPNDADPFQPGVCTPGNTRGPDTSETCETATEGGRAASLVVATGVPGMVLFSDSVNRMFGDPAALDTCDVAVTSGAGACQVARDGTLYMPGWPPAGETDPLWRIRVRAVSLLPGATKSKGPGPCERAEARLTAARQQCDHYRQVARNAGSILDTSPPYSSLRDDAGADPANVSLTVLGEAFYAPGATAPDPDRWIEVLVVPSEHAVALTIRRDVAPEAIQPDGLLGTALFEGTNTVLDSTDPNPGLRVRCLEPASGRCLVLPDCNRDGDPACCHGMPRTLLEEIIVRIEDDVCCSALSANDLAEIQTGGERCIGYDPR